MVDLTRAPSLGAAGRVPVRQKRSISWTMSSLGGAFRSVSIARSCFHTRRARVLVNCLKIHFLNACSCPATRIHTTPSTALLLAGSNSCRSVMAPCVFTSTRTHLRVSHRRPISTTMYLWPQIKETALCILLGSCKYFRFCSD